MTSRRLFVAAAAACLGVASVAMSQTSAQRPAVNVGADGAVTIQNAVVRLSGLLSDGARKVLMRTTPTEGPGAPVPVPAGIADMAEVRRIYNENLQANVAHMREVFPVDIEETTIEGIPAAIVTPRGGVPEKNRNRLFLNGPGGGFRTGVRGNGLLISIPVAATLGVKVVTITYRQAPEYRFPAASEDLLKVWDHFTKTYKPENVGMVGCSAGGSLVSQTTAMLIKEGRPTPGALGVYCAGLGSAGAGDSGFLAALSVTNAPQGRLQAGGPGVAAAPPAGPSYMDGADRNDFAVNPLGDEKLLAKWPPTIFFTASRDGASSGALHSYRKLIALGIDSQILVFDGLYHGFMTNPDFPEAQEGYRIASSFFDKHLGRDPRPAAPSLPKSEEYLLLGNAVRGAGEPMIAVDPTDPRNIVAVAMGNLQQLGGKPASVGDNAPYHLAANSTINWLGVTHDGGITWQVKEQPILSGKFTRCPDAFADVTKDGIFLAGCEPRETASAPDFYGMSAIQVSRDKGNTWGPVVEMIGDYGLTRFAPGLKPVSGGFPPGAADRIASNSPWDRPFTHIDDSTGVIYGVAHGGSTAIDAAPGTRRPQAYITASADGGKSFGAVYAWDSPDYPQASRGLGATAAHGMAAVIYIARSVPAAQSATCPCAILGVTRNLGRTFDYTVLRNVSVTPAPPGRGRGRGGPGATGGLSGIAADPTRAGRLALLKYEGVRYSVATSADAGRTWTPFVPAGSTPDAVSFSKPAFEFSRDGVLGLMWRATYADGAYDVWAAISRDGGAAFSKPLRVSHSRSPAYDRYRNAGLFGDDIQDFSMDRETMHLVWGDSRSGFQGVWYGKVRLSDFEF